MTTKKKRNRAAQDATLINVRARKSEITELQKRMDILITHIIRAEDKANVALKALGIQYKRSKKAR